MSATRTGHSQFGRMGTWRLRLVGLACVLALGGCSGSAPTSTPGSSGSSTPTDTGSIAPDTADPSSSSVVATVTPATGSTATPAPELPPLGHFVAAGSMVSHHNDDYNPPVPALLHDGRVLFTGGSTATGPLAAVELFDPSSNSFVATTSLPIGRSNHTATTLLDGDVLIAGGMDDSVTLQSAHIYHPATASYGKSYPMTVSRAGHTATLLRDGRVLIAGGGSVAEGTSTLVLGSAELYDPNTGTFSATGTMVRPRTGAQAVSLIDGRVLIVGGAYVGDFTGSPFQAPWAEIYNPSTGRFTAVPGAAVHENLEILAVTMIDGKVLVVGGIADGGTCQTTAEIFDPSSGHFTATTRMGGCATAATLLGNDEVLVAGGASHPSGQVYDEGARTWRTIAALPSGFVADSATALADGRVLITAMARAQVWTPR